LILRAPVGAGAQGTRRHGILRAAARVAVADSSPAQLFVPEPHCGNGKGPHGRPGRREKPFWDLVFLGIRFFLGGGFEKHSQEEGVCEVLGH